MTRKHFIALLGCMIVMTTVLLTLYATSNLNKDIFRGEFERKFVTDPNLAQAKFINLKFTSYYIAGVTDGSVYLGNYSAPLHLLRVNLHSADSQGITVSGLEGLKVREPMMFRTKIDSPYFFMDHGITPLITKGKVGQWKAERLMPDSGYYFVEALPISNSTFALKSYSTKTKGYQLAKKMALDTPYFKFKYGLLEKQKDGIFCVEGKLHFDRELNRLIYLYRYRNDFILMDTSMELLSKHKTIDPFDSVLIKTEHLASENTTMLASPPFVINNLSCVSNGRLYVQSNILAKNEKEQRFRTESTIDVYDLTNGNYIHSFYITKFDNNKVLDFFVTPTQIICIYAHVLVIYDYKTNQPI